MYIIYSVMNRIYKVSFSKSSFELVDDYDKLSDIDKERISDLDAVAFFDFDDEVGYKFFIIVDSIEFEFYSKVLDENLIQHKIEDLSDEILKGKLDVEKYVSKFVSTLNTIKFSFFVDDLNEWIYENLDIDIVLDRITEVGMNHLRKVEKNFLSNYSQNK